MQNEIAEMQDAADRPCTVELPDGFESVEIGMTPREVADLLGEPDSTEDSVGLAFDERVTEEWDRTEDTHGVYVGYRDDKVTSTGYDHLC